MPASRSRRFCLALLEETRGEVLRWASIDSVDDRLGMDPDEAAVLAAELDDAGLMRVGGATVSLSGALVAVVHFVRRPLIESRITWKAWRLLRADGRPHRIGRRHGYRPDAAPRRTGACRSLRWGMTMHRL